MASNYGDNRESTLTKVATVSANDLFRVVASGASRNITLTNLVSVIDPLITKANTVQSVAANYIASASVNVVLADVSGGGISVTLPAASISEGVLIQVKKTDASTNDITVQTAGGNIDGSSTATLSGSGGARPGASFICDGSNWFILNA